MTEEQKIIEEHLIMSLPKASFGAETFAICARAYFPDADISSVNHVDPWGTARHLCFMHKEQMPFEICITYYNEHGLVLQYNKFPLVIRSEKTFLKILKKLKMEGWKAE